MVGAEPPLPTRGQRLALLGFGAFVTVQLTLTALDRNVWPFCSYNLFNRVLPHRIPQPRVRLLEGDHASKLLPVHGMMPLEFFRVVRIFGMIYRDSSDEELKRRFSERLLRRLNTEPWGAFDEVKASYRPSTPDGFSGFEVHEVQIDVRDYDVDRDGPLHGRRVLYVHAPEARPAVSASA
jgi:hypothetical protein